MSRSRTLAATSARLHTGPRVPRRRSGGSDGAPSAHLRRARNPTFAADPASQLPSESRCDRWVFAPGAFRAVTRCCLAVNAFDGRNSAVITAPFDHPGKQLRDVGAGPASLAAGGRRRCQMLLDK